MYIPNMEPSLDATTRALDQSTPFIPLKKFQCTNQRLQDVGSRLPSWCHQDETADLSLSERASLLSINSAILLHRKTVVGANVGTAVFWERLERIQNILNSQKKKKNHLIVESVFSGEKL